MQVEEVRPDCLRPVSAGLIRFGFSRSFQVGIRLNPVALQSQIKLVARYIFISINLPARPTDFQVCTFCVCQPDMHPKVAAGQETAAAANFKHLPGSARSRNDLGSEARAVAFHSLSSDGDPVRPGMPLFRQSVGMSFLLTTMTSMFPSLLKSANAVPRPTLLGIL